ncbi:hypothetical protein SHIRM173S_13054 [Streptomyces hirsutus]
MPRYSQLLRQTASTCWFVMVRRSVMVRFPPWVRYRSGSAPHAR